MNLPQLMVKMGNSWTAATSDSSIHLKARKGVQGAKKNYQSRGGHEHHDLIDRMRGK